MADWRESLGEALAGGDPAHMRAMLQRVPREVLRQALPQLQQAAQASEKAGRLEEAWAMVEPLVQALDDHLPLRAQCGRLLLGLGQPQRAREHAQRMLALSPQSAAGQRLLAQACDALGEADQALAAYQALLRLEPADEAARRRVQALEEAQRKQDLLQRVLDPQAAAEAPAPPAPPPPSAPPAFDPALLADASLPPGEESFRVEGLRRHLRRYAGQLSPRQTIARLEDPAWLAAWDTALASTAGYRVWLRGSELGLFALRALGHGAAYARCLEAHPLDARIAAGMVQKHFLPAWQARHGAAVRDWSEEQRSASFDEFTRCVDIVAADAPPAEGTEDAAQDCDCLVFTALDHTLLGTGIVKAVRALVGGQRGTPARLLPARATVHAMAVQWRYPGTDVPLEAVNELRWSAYPQPLELDEQHWTALTEPQCVGRIDFADFHETTWEPALPVSVAGRMDALVFWYELELGSARLSTAPNSALRCIRPAVQYTDPVAVQPGQALPLRVHVRETRLYFETVPAPTLPRRGGLPGWYVPMLGDTARNEAYRGAIERAVRARPQATVLDIGAGCGLLSLMAARAGAPRVVGCETDAALADIATRLAAQQGVAPRVTVLHKDCRKLQQPGDLAERAALALFELFDCSLIGEGILHFLAHAREHLLTADARYLPAGARLRAQVVEYRISRVWDLDATLLNPYRTAPGFINVDAAQLDYRPLTEIFDLFEFDFSTAQPTAEQKALNIPATAAGIAGAVLFWFDLKLDEECWLSNDPAAGKKLHWKQGLQALPEVHVAPAMELRLVAGHDGSGLKFMWAQDGMPANNFLKVPRWDPRWLAINTELEHQTQGLLQHCAQHPAEYSKVLEIARRFAVNPGAHEVDPVVAQRFAAMLLRR